MTNFYSDDRLSFEEMWKMIDAGHPIDIDSGDFEPI